MDECGIEKTLHSFSCSQDSDIESFLHNRAIQFENLNKSRTYLLLNQEELLSGRTITVYGYFSLALKVLSVPDKMPNRMRMKLDGFSAKNFGEPISDFPCYLIGQLARNSSVEKKKLSGNDLIQSAFDIIAGAVQSVGGRLVMIECREEEHLIRFYSEKGFEIIANNSDHHKSMVQMIRRIC